MAQGAKVIDVTVPGMDDLLRESSVINDEFKFDLADYLAGWTPDTELKSMRKTLLTLAHDADIVLDLHCDGEAAMHLYALTPQAEQAAQLGALLQAQALLLLLAKFPEMLSAAATNFAPHDVTFYLRELAAAYHSYYDAERILVEDEAVKRARLALVAATAQVLHNGLAVLGVSAPQKM